mmetsp:Transcript_11500/g.26288  ORF Transcript_11500/g.26288 Transcript_11500/m.26288 type:complete len:91 (-) Transcript_11500:1055-1327(-)
MPGDPELVHDKAIGFVQDLLPKLSNDTFFEQRLFNCILDRIPVQVHDVGDDQTERERAEQKNKTVVPFDGMQFMVTEEAEYQVVIPDVHV